MAETAGARPSEACRHAIDTLKAQVPIWKKEFYADGAVWLEEPGSGAMQVAPPGPPRA